MTTLNMPRIYRFEKESLNVYKRYVQEGKLEDAFRVLKTTQKIRQLMIRFYQYKPFTGGI